MEEESTSYECHLCKKSIACDLQNALGDQIVMVREKEKSFIWLFECFDCNDKSIG